MIEGVALIRASIVPWVPRLDPEELMEINVALRVVLDLE
jgi:hypothetical protein